MKVFAAEVPDTAPNVHGFALADSQGNRVPTSVSRLFLEEHPDGTASLHCYAGAQVLSVDPYDAPELVRAAAARDFAVENADWYEPIFADMAQGATLRHGGTKSVDCPTLQEAVIALRGLPDGQRQNATIKTASGALYKADDVDRLHYGPKPF